MFDIGWTELMLIGVVTIFAFGPEDIPKLMYNLGRIMRRFRYMRYALSNQFESFMEEAEKKGQVPSATAHLPQTDTHENNELEADEGLECDLPEAETRPVNEADIKDSDEPSKAASQ